MRFPKPRTAGLRKTLLLSSSTFTPTTNLFFSTLPLLPLSSIFPPLYCTFVLPLSSPFFLRFPLLYSPAFCMWLKQSTPSIEKEEEKKASNKHKRSNPYESESLSTAAGSYSKTTWNCLNSSFEISLKLLLTTFIRRLNLLR